LLDIAAVDKLGGERNFMKFPLPILATLILAPLAAPLCAAEPESPAPVAVSTGTSGPYAPTIQSFSAYVCPEWFRDAKFGIWSHWGPDSIPGISNNYANEMYDQGSSAYKWQLAHFGHPSKFGYKDVIESWKAEKFDPDALVARYKAAGAKYIVALATHHDNFDNFDSTYHEWNSVRHGPHKDIVGLWREATLKAGLRFGVSSHADERGWNYIYGARLSDKTGPLAGVPYDGANPAYKALYNSPAGPRDKPPEWWKQEWMKRHLELVDKYQPDLLYFDGGVPHGQYGMQLIAHYLNENAKEHNGSEEGVVNVKAGSFVRDYERGVSATLQDKPWQDDTSLSGWFYMNHNPHNDPKSLVKGAPTVIDTLIDVVSKNGNLLMNFPQRGDGSLYPECEEVLDELAKWMPVNGEGIFDTRPWTTFGEGPSVIAAGYMNELIHPLTWQDIRYTTKGNVIYAFCLGIPQGEVTMKSLGSLRDGIANVELLGSSEKVAWKATPEGLVIEPSAKWPCDHAVAYKISRKQVD
jgi:alpha-L-fucosidase